jgi:glyoxylase-like metal-dependent hydrolase (beta-lactamase superfamily II)
MPLEDDFTDIVKKARMGQGLSLEAVARGAGLEAREVAALERGERAPSLGEVGGIARALKLRSAPLGDIAKGAWLPAATPSSVAGGVTGVETVHGDIGGYAVKGCVVYDSEAKEAVFVDTAYNAQAMLEVLKRRGLRLTGICLTHGHADHADGIEQILVQWPVPVYLGHEDENLLSWRPPRERLTEPGDGRTITVGRLTIRCLTTPGHTPGGICYQAEGLDAPLCFVGDTLFAGSIGRSNPFALYPVHLESVRRRVLRLPPATLLLPGHGPATTVREELVHNPFAASS